MKVRVVRGGFYIGMELAVCNVVGIWVHAFDEIFDFISCWLS